MVERLGNVVYWAASAAAALTFGLGATMAINETYNPTAILAIMGIIGALIWLTGRAVRYVLSGN